VFEAHKPHKETNKKTWFGYWRDDGYIKTKHMGRIDLNHQWKDIKSRWLEAYHNNEVHAGESVTAYVDSDCEWVAEAYMETDYSTLTKENFEEVVKNYAIFKLLNKG
jgi:hypothetical protein